MARFIQLHLITSYPPANLNRDDLGRPKTAMMGDTPRLRVSSQSLKRAWRTSDLFEKSMAGHIGVRTKTMGVYIYDKLVEGGLAHKKSLDWSKLIAAEFGKLKKNSPSKKEDSKEQDEDKKRKKELVEVEIEQLAHFSPEEQSAIDDLIVTLIEKQEEPQKEDLQLLRKKHSAADIALFGRMLASSPAYNVEAAVQVAHAISVHKVVVEDDYFTAVDDLNNGEDDSGAAHLGETEFAAGLFYLYICIDKELLIESLGNDTQLANKTIASLIECSATVAPTGKQNSFASRARASYILCEQGNQQPRSLSVAFLKPVAGSDMLNAAVNNLNKTLENMDKTYGLCADTRCHMNAQEGEGSLSAIIECATESIEGD